MKKRILMMLMAGLSPIVALCDTVDPTRDQFYFETLGNTKLKSTYDWTVSVSPGSTTKTSGTVTFTANLEQPHTTVGDWGLSNDFIANAVWQGVSSPSFTYTFTSESGTKYLYMLVRYLRYNLAFNANDGSSVAAMNGNSYPDSIQLPESTRWGYNFQGWTGSTFAGVKKGSQTGETLGVTADGQTITLTADWSPITSEVTFDVNGEGATVSPSSIQVDYNSTYGGRGSWPTPTRADYEFNGWWTSASGGNQIVSSTKVAITSSQTLYAHWVAIPKFTVRFYGLGGAELSSQNVVSNKAASAPATNVPGYTFKAWDPTDFSHVISNMEIRAQYSPNRYTVSYDANGGNGSMTNDVFTYDVEYSLQSNAFKRSIYEFVGWASKSDASTDEVEYIDHATVSNLTTEANATNTLYAIWRSLLTDYSIAADCTNLVLECNEANKWNIDYASGYSSTSSVRVAGTILAPMTTTIAGTGTLTFRMKAYSALGNKVSTICGLENEDTGASEVEDKENVAAGEWLAYSFHKETLDEASYSWSYSGINAGDYAYVDQVHWYPGRTVSFGSLSYSLTGNEKNSIIESVLQNWEVILGASASAVSSITTSGNSISNAVEIIGLMAQGWNYADYGVTVAIDGDPSKATLEFSDVVLPTMITNAQVTVDQVVFEYNGDEHKPEILQVTLDGTPLDEVSDYMVAYANNVNAGEATLTLCGTNNYFGTYTTNFTITAKSITNSSVTVESPIVYTGSEIRPLPTVTDVERGVQLVKDSDYTLTWANNVDVGEADVTVTGMGNYKDEVTVHFTIKSKVEAELEAAFAGLPAVVESDGAGGWKVSITADIADAAVEVPDDLGNVTLDLCGHTFAGAAGQSPIRIVKGSGTGNATKLAIVTTSSGAAAVTGGAGAPAITVDDGVQDGVSIVVGTGLTVQGGGGNVPAIEAPATVSVEGGESIVKATYDMSNAGWDYAGEFTYDGYPKTVLVTGLPAGVTASYTGNSATEPGTYTAHVTFAYDEMFYNAPTPMEDLSWTIREPEQPVKPAVSGTLNVAFAKAQTVIGVLRNASDTVAGMVQIKAGKISKKKGTVKISASITTMDGKKISAKSVNMLLNVDGTMAGTLAFKEPIGEMPFNMVADGSFILANATYGMLAEKVGGELPNGSKTFTVAMDPLPGLDVGFEFIGSTIPNGVAITVSAGKKLDAGKSATIKYMKIKKNGNVWYDLVGLEKSNRFALKLSYAPKTGIFKGSFKVYATNAASLARSVKPKLKKYSVKVWGLMIGEGNDLFGIGEATCKKLTTSSWRVDIK